MATPHELFEIPSCKDKYILNFHNTVTKANCVLKQKILTNSKKTAYKLHSLIIVQLG